MGKLEGKVAIVTGAARGQGEAEARLFVEAGARVVVADVLDDLADEVASDLGDGAVPCHLDVTKPSDWEAAIEFTRARFGAIDVLVNNAGIVRAATIEEMSYDDYLLVVSVNQHGCWLGIKHVIPAMRASGGGSIVNVSSQAGITPSVSISAYAASKFAIRGITRVAAAELGHDGIRVNAVLPGAVDTEMTASHTYSPERRRAAYAQQPVARIAEPVEIAKLVLFLASDDSSYCTGSDFLIDGGALATLQVPRPEPV